MAEEMDVEIDEMSPVSVKVTDAQFQALSELLRRERYPNRSEAIRAALRDLFREKEGKY
ncbi:MAG: ribbon-helix-helix domain-containing protein [Candidatus Kariarchaeaceae archaeon]|jgi:Arc/MetJ-type ribon-helix-helix transcriptional regulator